MSDPTGTYQFTSDNMGRLTNTTTSYAFLTERNFATSYDYDAVSNRTGFTNPESGMTSYVYDTLNRLQTLTPPMCCWSMRSRPRAKRGTGPGRTEPSDYYRGQLSFFTRSACEASDDAEGDTG